MHNNVDFPNLNRQDLKSVPSKKSKDRIKLKEEFRDKVIIITQKGDNFIAAFEGSDGNFERGSTESMAIGRLILRNSEPA